MKNYLLSLVLLSMAVNLLAAPAKNNQLPGVAGQRASAPGLDQRVRVLYGLAILYVACGECSGCRSEEAHRGADRSAPADDAFINAWRDRMRAQRQQ